MKKELKQYIDEEMSNCPLTLQQEAALLSAIEKYLDEQIPVVIQEGVVKEVCSECKNPYPHGHTDGSFSCEDCGNKWQTVL